MDSNVFQMFFHSYISQETVWVGILNCLEAVSWYYTLLSLPVTLKHSRLLCFIFKPDKGWDLGGGAEDRCV